MISAEVIKGVQELLEDQGVKQNTGERFADYVARGLGITGAQAEALLTALHDGAEVDDAVRAAGIDATVVNHDLLTRFARAIGSTLGKAGL